MTYLRSYGPKGIKALVLDCLAVSPAPHYRCGCGSRMQMRPVLVGSVVHTHDGRADLTHNPPHNHSHMNLTECLALLDILQPQQAYLVGMCCEVGAHDAMNARLRGMGYPHVQLAWDGMVLRGMPMR